MVITKIFACYDIYLAISDLDIILYEFLFFHIQQENEFDSHWASSIGLDRSRVATIGSPLSEKEEWGTNHNFFVWVIEKHFTEDIPILYLIS